MRPDVENFFSNVIVFFLLIAVYFLFYVFQRCCASYGDNQQHYGPERLETRRSASVAVARLPPRRLEENDQIVFNKYRKEDGGGGCVICLEEYKDGETRAGITACSHRFHAACIKAWLVRNDNCPLCRSTLVV